MRSTASIKGHPIHPALVMFPFAGLWLAFLFNTAGVLTARSAWWTAGGYLALVGIVSAGVAAVPGFVDYVFTVPPKSTAKARATKHMVANLTAVALFVVACAIRGDVKVEPSTLVLVLQGAGVGLLSVAGWMGGTLVSRNQIGVDHRYANAGTWRETKSAAPHGRPVEVARSGDLEVNQMQLVKLDDGRRVVLGRTAQGYVVFDDACTHRGASLADGVMICGTVQCPWHGSQFDVATGVVKAGPAKKAVMTYDVEIKEGKIFLT